MSEWIEHDGKGMPVDGDKLVEVRQRDGWESGRPVKASYWTISHDNWTHDHSRQAYDIVAYRVQDTPPAKDAGQ